MNRIAMLLVLIFVLVAAPVARAELTGERLFNQKCIMCHIVKGKGGDIGPELTRAGARFSDTQIRNKMMYPKRQNPSTSMPSFQTLPGAEFDAIVTYVRSLR